MPPPFGSAECTPRGEFSLLPAAGGTFLACLVQTQKLGGAPAQKFVCAPPQEEGFFYHPGALVFTRRL